MASFFYDLLMIRDSALLFWGHPVYHLLSLLLYRNLPVTSRPCDVLTVFILNISDWLQ